MISHIAFHSFCLAGSEGELTKRLTEVLAGVQTGVYAKGTALQVGHSNKTLHP